MTTSERPLPDNFSLGARQAGPVFVGLVSEQDTSAVIADLDGGRHTLFSSSSQAVAALQTLLEVIRATGEDVSAHPATAAGIAAVAEADRVRPGASTWTPERVLEGRRSRLPPPRGHISMGLGDVLLNRRSACQFGPLSATDLSTLLFHAARVRATWSAPDDYPASSRAAPSAGARHPIDIVVVPDRVSGFLPPTGSASSSYLFDPMTCELVHLDGAIDRWFARCLDEVQELLGERPAVVLALAARVNRTLSRYRGGLSLVYRDAGCLMATVGFVSAGLGLACRPVARSAPRLAGNRDTPTDWIDVGGIALGSLTRNMA